VALLELPKLLILAIRMLGIHEVPKELVNLVHMHSLVMDSRVTKFPKKNLRISAKTETWTPFKQLYTTGENYPLSGYKLKPEYIAK